RPSSLHAVHVARAAPAPPPPTASPRVAPSPRQRGEGRGEGLAPALQPVPNPLLRERSPPDDAIGVIQSPVGTALRYQGGSMKKKHLAAAAAAILLALPVQAADSVKIGFVTTLSGPAGIIGKHMKDSADLALAMLGGKIGGLPAQIVYGDDQFKPDVGRQVADEML